MNVKSIILVAAFASLTVFGDPQTNGFAVTEAKSPIRVAQSGPPSMKEIRERTEKMAKEDPQRFAQITNRMARWRQRRAERASANLKFLKSFDANEMTAEQKQTHEKYQDLIARREQLEEKMQDLEMTDEDHENIFREMRETEYALRHAARTERETLVLVELKSLGLSEEKSSNACVVIEKIINATESQYGFSPSSSASRPQRSAGNPIFPTANH